MARIRLAGSAASGDALEKVVEVSPTATGTFELPAPSEAIDLSFFGPSLLPFYLWDVDPRLGRIPSVVTIRGGSGAAGILVDRETGQRLVGARVTLTPIEGVSDGHREIVSPFSAASSKRGFFQVQGLEARVYSVRVRRPKESFDLTLPDVTIGASGETFLGELEVGGPAMVTFSLKPPLGTDRKPWQLTLKNLGQAQRDLEGIRRTVGRLGDIRLDNVNPGRYQVEVRLSSGQLFFIEPAQLREGEQSITIDVEPLRVEGQVRFDGSPLSSAAVTVSGRGLLSTTTDTEGEFPVG